RRAASTARLRKPNRVSASRIASKPPSTLIRVPVLTEDIHGRNIGRGPLQLIELVRRYPSEVCVLRLHRLASHESADIGGQRNRREVVRVFSRHYVLVNLDVTVELFVDLSSKRHLGPLARLQLAARKLPHTRQLAVGSSLSAQHLAVTNNDGADDFNRTT